MIRHALVLLALVVGCNKSPQPSPTSQSSSTSLPSSSSPSAPAPSSGNPAPKVDTFSTPAGELTVTPIHHATFLLRLHANAVNANLAIYLDPVAADASYEGLPKADFVFITDIHPDHMDPAGLDKVKKPDTVVVGPSAVKATMPLGVVLKNGETHDFALFQVEAVPMYNLTRGPSAGKFFHDKGRGDGYLFTFGKSFRVYVSGDTECTPEMKALTNIDVAFVCMNLPYTMPPSEATACIDAFKPKVVYPYHYRNSNLDELRPASGIEVRKRPWY